MSEAPKPWEFRSKTTKQRFWIMFGGVLFNFILALIIYSMSLYAWGEEYLPLKNAHYGIYCDSLALEVGLQHQDVILKVGDKTPERFNDILIELLMNEATTITVKRQGQTVVVPIPKELSQKIIAQRSPTFAMPFVPFVIDSLLPEGNAKIAGLRVNDRIIAIDTIPTPAFYDFVSAVQNYKGQSTNVLVERNREELSIPINISENAMIGVGIRPLNKLYQFEKIEYGFFESIPAGIKMGVNTLGSYIKQFKLVFTKEGAKQVGGFAAIGGLFPTIWDWEVFWKMTAFLSIILAFMNILPIPALDGGHLMFLIYEIITGKKPEEKFMERAQIIGMSILFALLIFANGNDLIRLLGS
jgi:regulator of sigma E protease